MYTNMYSGLRMQPSCDGSRVHLFFFGRKVFLSNSFSSPINIDGLAFTSAEQAYQYKKAKFFGDDETANKILGMTNAADMAMAGWHVMLSNKNSLWNAIAKDVMTEIITAKFMQNGELGIMLKQTSPCELVEANPFDKYFGNGMNINNDNNNCFHNWSGQNVTGKILESIRSEL